ncbi:hypothetical protein D3C77_170600 [compost metagenome]
MNSASVLRIPTPEEASVYQNSLGDKYFAIQCPLTGKHYSLNFDWTYPFEVRVYAQRLFLSCTSIGGYADKHQRITPSSISQARLKYIAIHEICATLAELFPGQRLYSLDKNDLRALVRHIIKEKMAKNGPYSRSKLMNICHTLNESHDNYATGKIDDGAKFLLTRKDYRAIAEPLLNPLNITFETWYMGDKEATLPLTCASAMLAEALTLLESDEAKIARCLFNAWRKVGKATLKCWFDSNVGLDRLRILRELEGGRIPEKNYVDTSALALGTELSKIDLDYFHPHLPWRSPGKLADFCMQLMQAGLVVIALLSAFRVHELTAANINDFTPDVDGTWWLSTPNDKTDQGMIAPRPLCGLAAEIAELLSDLTPYDTKLYPSPLFHRAYTSKHCSLAYQNNPDEIKAALEFGRHEKNTLMCWFREFYKTKVLAKYPDAFEIHPRTTIHKSRHVFAEFSLRRFDGNVAKKVREHYRHPANSRAYFNYAYGKLTEDAQHGMEREYLKEVLFRIAKGRVDDRFLGPAAKRVRHELENILVVTPDEFDERLAALESQFLRFIGFEWGFCMIRVGEEHLANCCDRDTSLPKTDALASPRLCSGCVHSMHNSLQRDYLSRIAIAHQKNAIDHPLKVIGKMSAEVVRIIERRLETDDEI